MAKSKITFCPVCSQPNGSCDAEKHEAVRLAKARKQYERMKYGITHEEAVAKIKDLLNGCGIRGMKQTFGDGLYREWERASTVQAQLYVYLDQDWDHKMVNPDDNTEAVYHYKPRIDVSWSATSRSVPFALACVKLYEEVVAFAAELEAFLNSNTIYHIYKH